MRTDVERGLDLDGYRRAVIAEMAALLQGREPARFYRMLTYHLGQTDEQGASHGDGASAGKLLRPILCLLGCAAVGGDPARAVPVAAGIELIHCFTLLHDDIQDRSLERRHRRTVWAIWGEAHAISAGDAMFALAQVAVLRAVEIGVPAETVVQVARLINETCLRVCEGQFLDIEAERGGALTEAEYLDLIGRKTAALLACSAEAGALLGGGDVAQVGALREFGRLAGLAFQMQDDVLGIWGDPAVTGKPAHDDLRARKQTLPVLRAGLPRPGAADLDRPAGETEIATALARLEAAGARADTEAQARRYLAEADAALAAAPLAAGPRRQLREAAAALLGRVR